MKPSVQPDHLADHQALVAVLKQILKARGMRYSDLAHHLGVAEITVKRFFAGSLSALHHVYGVCDFLGVSFFDVARLAAERAPADQRMTLEQDAFFAEDPRRYPIFLDLNRREHPERVRETWGLNAGDFFRFLRGLEKVRFIDVYPGNRLRFRYGGPLLLHPQGRVREIFLDQNEAFLKSLREEKGSSRATLQVSEVLLSEEHAAEMRAEIIALARKWRAKSYADETLLPKSAVRSVRWLLGFGPFRGSWR